jgi:hypothetical protein
VGPGVKEFSRHKVLITNEIKHYITIEKYYIFHTFGYNLTIKRGWQLLTQLNKVINPIKNIS